MFYLFGELFFAQLVKSEELAGQLHVVYKPTTGQFDPNNYLAVRNHHGHRAEVDLQVLGKLLATCIAWVLIIQQNKKEKRSLNWVETRKMLILHIVLDTVEHLDLRLYFYKNTDHIKKHVCNLYNLQHICTHHQLSLFILYVLTAI